MTTKQRKNQNTTRSNRSCQKNQKPESNKIVLRSFSILWRENAFSSSPLFIAERRKKSFSPPVSLRNPAGPAASFSLGPYDDSIN